MSVVGAATADYVAPVSIMASSNVLPCGSLDSFRKEALSVSILIITTVIGLTLVSRAELVSIFRTVLVLLTPRSTWLVSRPSSELQRPFWKWVLGFIVG